ncbi:hypothetical protein D9M68_906250 [compost metagenome]
MEGSSTASLRTWAMSASTLSTSITWINSPWKRVTAVKYVDSAPNSGGGWISSTAILTMRSTPLTRKPCTERLNSVTTR